MNRNLFVSIATYTPLSVDMSLCFLKKAFDKLLAPFVNPEEVLPTLQWCQANSQRVYSCLIDAASWDKITSSAPFLWMMIQAWKETNRESGKNPFVAGISVHFSPSLDQASTLEFSASRDIYGNTINPVVQERIVELALSTFREVDGINGYVTVDYVSANVHGSMSPYERAIGLSYPWASRGFRSKARGYYWGNLLHKSHIDLLGRRFLSIAPVYIIKAIGSDGHYIQLTDDINNIDRSKLVRLKDLFAPILPEGFPQSPEYYQSLPDLLL